MNSHRSLINIDTIFHIFDSPFNTAALLDSISESINISYYIHIHTFFRVHYRRFEDAGKCATVADAVRSATCSGMSLDKYR
jgi:hypothetical protein